jgi:hypothetical protein
MSSGLSHMTFIISDLDNMTRILTEVLKAEEVYGSGQDSFSLSEEKFFLVGDVWIAIMKGAPLSSAPTITLPSRSKNRTLRPGSLRSNRSALNSGRRATASKAKAGPSTSTTPTIICSNCTPGTLEMRLESYRKILDERRAAQ